MLKSYNPLECLVAITETSELLASSCQITPQLAQTHTICFHVACAVCFQDHCCQSSFVLCIDDPRWDVVCDDRYPVHPATFATDSLVDPSLASFHSLEDHTHAAATI